MNVKEDLTTAQQMTLLLQSVSTWWEGSDAPALTTRAIDWISPTMLVAKVTPRLQALLVESCQFCVNTVESFIGSY